jgi:hypothetical protein
MSHADNTGWVPRPILSSANIEVLSAPGTDSTGVVTFAKALAKSGDYDRIFCVFDRNGHDSYEAALGRVSQLSVGHASRAVVEASPLERCERQQGRLGTNDLLFGRNDRRPPSATSRFGVPGRRDAVPERRQLGEPEHAALRGQNERNAPLVRISGKRNVV